jgi:hypothetical protein
MQYHVVSTLDLPICTRVDDHGPFHADVIVVTEIQEFFSSELSVIVSNDIVSDAKTKIDVLDEIYDLLGANFSQRLHLDPLSKLIDCDEQVG